MSEQISTSNPPPVNPSDADLSSYEAASRADPVLRSFDSNLKARTNQTINALAVGLDVRSLPVESLAHVSDNLLEMNQEVVKVILESKKEVLKNKRLSVLIDDFLENCVLTLDFGSALDACFKRVAHLESITNVAIQKFEEEHYTVEIEQGSVKSYPKTLEEFRNFRRVGDPFTEDFFELFNSVVSHQYSFLKRLQEKKREMDNKLKKLKTWRRVSNVTFVVALVSFWICTVVAASVRAPAVVTGVAAAASLPLVVIGIWLKLLFKKREKDLRGESEIVSSMQIGVFVVAKDLDNLKVLTDKFKVETGFEGLLGNADFAISGGGDAVVIAVEENKKKMDRFIKEIHSLVEHVDRCTKDTMRARSVMLQRVIGYPSS